MIFMTVRKRKTNKDHEKVQTQKLVTDAAKWTSVNGKR